VTPPAAPRCTVDAFPAIGSRSISDLSACLASKCPGECNIKHGGFAAYLADPDHAADCEMCLNINTDAGANAVACGSSAECDAFWKCYMTCPTPDCKFACASAHDAGVALFRSLQNDYSSTCKMKCGFGGYWACVGKTSGPGWIGTVAFTVPVIDLINHTASDSGVPGIPGQSVAICNACPCGTPASPVLADGSTDDAGFVTLQFQGGGLNGCVQVTDPDGGRVPYFGYWGYPLSEAVVDPQLGPSSPAADIVGQSAQTLTPEELDAATGTFIGVKQDPSLGLVGAAVFDCFANPAYDVRVTIDPNGPETSTYYGPGDAGATLRPGDPGYSGQVFLFNVPPGEHKVTARPLALEGGASSVVNIGVAAFTTTAVGMFPTSTSN
jgi:hypothetical protein